MLPARGSPYLARMSAICWSAVVICVILHQRSALFSEPCSHFVLTFGTADRPGSPQCVRAEILNLGCVQSLSYGAQQHRSLRGLVWRPAERHQAGPCISAHLIPPRGRKLRQALLGLRAPHQRAPHPATRAQAAPSSAGSPRSASARTSSRHAGASCAKLCWVSALRISAHLIPPRGRKLRQALLGLRAPHQRAPHPATRAQAAPSSAGSPRSASARTSSRHAGASCAKLCW